MRDLEAICSTIKHSDNPAGELDWDFVHSTCRSAQDLWERQYAGPEASEIHMVGGVLTVVYREDACEALQALMGWTDQ